nr:receptor-type tyrosine-protein phosphatase kappa-like isoform X2 [Crassostrea gigas]
MVDMLCLVFFLFLKRHVFALGCSREGFYGENCTEQCPINCQDRRCDINTGHCLRCVLGYQGPTCNQECQQGYYGAGCLESCSVNCYLTSCYKESGHCDRGCSLGWTGNSCDQQCQSGFYGKDCTGRCSVNCYDTRGCDRFTGHCTRGCKLGWTRNTCDKQCQSGSYGRDCTGRCSVNCYDTRGCDRFTGLCNGGCKHGWTGNTCDKPCQFGYYGKDCTGRCSINCYSTSLCNRFTGHCTRGCKAGWTGNMCDRQCQPGFYGANCGYTCSLNCYYMYTNRCDTVSGYCNNGCLSGWTGSRCSQQCQFGSYGKDCTGRCSVNCYTTWRCNRFTGHCTDGCKAGWTGNTCDQQCQQGHYGRDCSQTCSLNCDEEDQCERTNGRCDNGCKPGWTGITCDQRCPSGQYGKNCLDTCSENCIVASKCDRFTGQCEGGCKQGWTGTTCDQECSVGFFGINCLNQCSENCNLTRVCDRLTGQCDGGCIPGWKGATCNETCDDTFYGINCTQNCEANCVNYSCNHQTGICNVYSQPLSDTDPKNLPGVIGGSTAAIIMIILFVVILVLYNRKRSSSIKKRNEQYTKAAPNTMAFSNLYQTIDVHLEENKGVMNTEMKQKLGETKKPKKVRKSRDPNDEDLDVDEMIHEENPYGDFYVNEEPLHDVAISNLGKTIEEKSGNEDDGFKKEYATLLYGEKYPCDVAKLPVNIPKNRFKTTFPYDHSRVVLADKRADYINANYIDGITEEKMYIATQGPKQNTVADFWWMIWQENVEQVVMLTNLMEGSKWKCVQYWPNLQTSMDCGSFSIHSIEEKQYAFYIVRKFTVTNKKCKDDRRTITQYHYTAWPDHGIPEPLCLLLFHDHVTRTQNGIHTGPVLVHCSAGIGRTGTYIAIDAFSEGRKTQNKINIAEYIKKMRRNRMNMVQTYEQYKTIFLTLLELFRAPPAVLSATEFLQKNLTEMSSKPANSSALKKELQRLLAVRPQYTEKDYKVTSQFHDPSASIHPLDKYVLFLTSNVPNRGSYINAISVPSFTNQNAFIITNYPTQGDTVDFLRLITDYDSGVVVCMEPLYNVESASKWLPTTARIKQVTPFTVKLQNEQTTEIKSSKIEIIKKGFNDKAWSVEITEPLNGLEENNSKTVTHILGLVSFARNTETDGPIVVMSRDGAALCGVFCAVYNLIQQLKMDEEIDVFSAVRLLQTRRPELCSTMREYQLLNETLQSFITSHMGENIYYNQ